MARRKSNVAIHAERMEELRERLGKIVAQARRRETLRKKQRFASGETQRRSVAAKLGWDRRRLAGLAGVDSLEWVEYETTPDYKKAEE